MTPCIVGDGSAYSRLLLIDQANRECPGIELGMSIPSARLIRVLTRMIACYGAPEAIRLDNGPAMISQKLTKWVAIPGIAIPYIQPGKPNQQVQPITNQWLVDYNEYRPHDSLGGVPPVRFMPRLG